MTDPISFDRDRRGRSIFLSDAVARIVVADNAGPIRTSIAGGPRQAATLFTTRKGPPFICSSNAERALAFASEADPAVARMLGQPHRLEFTSTHGVRHVYIPDFRRDLRSGLTEIIECKADDRPDKRGPAYERKLELAGEVYAQIGWRYRKLILADITAEPLYSSLKRIERDACLRLRPPEFHRVTDCLRAHGPMELGRLADAVAPRPRGKAVICALMGRGVVTIDLRRRLNPENVVSLFDPASEPLI
jgi:hypothetical protein